MKKKILSMTLAAILALASVTAMTGCGGSDSAEGEAGDAATVSTDGSTSMEKVIGSLGEQFMADNEGVTFTYNPTGSGSGITAV